MAVVLERPVAERAAEGRATAAPGAGVLSGAVAEVAARVRRSVVVVRGTRFGSGSGVIWDNHGIVVTNHHVVPGERAEVSFADGTRLPARVVARAEGLDVAALRLEGVPPAGLWVPAELGDSSRLRVGELVFAIGNPMGATGAVTLGIVSATGTGTWLGGPRPVIRAAIVLRPGNSGGALADARGRVVGIPHLVIGGDQAVAIPTNVVRQVLELSPEYSA